MPSKINLGVKGDVSVINKMIAILHYEVQRDVMRKIVMQHIKILCQYAGKHGKHAIAHVPYLYTLAYSSPSAKFMTEASVSTSLIKGF